jgi:hypothetical protein
MAFPTTTLIDNFNRANETPLSTAGNWSSPAFLGDGAYNLTGNQLVDPGGGGWRSIYWDVSFGPDSEVWCTTPVEPLAAIELIARLSSPGGGSAAGYMAHFAEGAGACGLYRIVSNIQTQIGGTATITIGNNDQFGLEVTGTGATVTISAYHKPAAGAWTQIITFGDTNAARITSAGFIGLAASIGAGGASIDDFSGGTVVSGVANLLIPSPRRRRNAVLFQM